jgi:ferredoxin
MLYIDNTVCIQCSACIPLCPVHAIYADDDIPEDQRHWIETNAERSQALPVVSDKQEALPGAEERKAALGY